MRTNAKTLMPKASWLGGVKNAAIVLLIMLLSTTTAWAKVKASGTCGDNLRWELKTSTLTITGTGDMKHFGSPEKVPWYYYMQEIHTVNLPEGLKHISSYAFYNAGMLSNINIPASVDDIGEKAFYGVKSCTITFPKGSEFAGFVSGTFTNFKGNLDMSNCTKITNIKTKSFKGYKGYNIILPVSLETIEEDAFTLTDKTTIKLANNNSVVYLNRVFHSVAKGLESYSINKALGITNNTNDKSNKLSIYRVSLTDISITFDRKDKSYVISNEQGLIDFAKMYTKKLYDNCNNLKFKLAADLDFTKMHQDYYDDANTGIGNFLPIGINDIAFNSEFDGQGHSITGLKYSGSDMVGLFSTIGNSGSVKNLTLINPSFSGNGYVGGIVGDVEEGIINKCNVINPYFTTSLGRHCGCISGAESDNIQNCQYDFSKGVNLYGGPQASSSYITENNNTPLFRLNLGNGIKSNAKHVYGDYIVVALNKKVKLNVESREGYDLKGFKSDDVTIEDGQFKMPAKNVSVTAAVWEAQDEINLKASQVNDLYWTTFYCGDAGYSILEDEEAFAYTATVHDDEIILHSLGKYIPKGSAVIIAGEDNSISMKRDDYGYPDFSVDNDLKGVDWPTARTSLTSNDSYALYMLSNKNNHFGFHHFTGTNVPARKAYFLIPASASAREFTMVFDEEATAIRDLRKANAESPLYDLNGRVVSGKSLKPGIYVKNGKKIVVK